MEKKLALVDVAVLLIFFNREKETREVFEKVKEARPSKLFLYQDGARKENVKDKEGIAACRKIVDEIDWECEIHTLFQEKNYGCDPSEYIAQKWAFSIVDKCIILEDDDVPSVSFFAFCKELLDKYENDSRIMMISGLNHEEVTEDVSSDYFFTRNCSIWGWASWRRVIESWDSKYSFLDDKESLERFKTFLKEEKLLVGFEKVCDAHRNTGKEHYESILISNVWNNHGLCIVPKKNMIHNIGLTADATHYVGDIDSVPKAIRSLFTMPTYEIDSPFVHPPYIQEHINYRKRVYKMMGWRHPILKVFRFISLILELIFSGKFNKVIALIKSKLTSYVI